jgi:HK97 family phage portal protein
MSLIQVALDGFGLLRAEMGGAPAPWDDFWYGPVGAGSSTGIRVTPDTAKRVAAVLACVNKIAKTIAMLPLKIYSERADGGKTIASSHPIYDVLYSRPNTQQTAFEFRQMMQGHLELRGNAYAEIIPGPRGVVDQLIPLHPDRVTPLLMKSTGRIVYRYDDPLSQQRWMNQEQVFHLRNFMDDGVVGQSTVTMGVDVFGLALAAQDYYARFLRNDARPGVIITGANFKTNQDRDAFSENWQKNQTGANRHKVAVLSPGMDVKTVGVSGKDAELLDARKFSRIDVCSLFDVPPHLIGETEKTASYASVEQFNIMFATYCILPRLVLWEQAIQRALIYSPKYFAKFSMGALLRGDTASRFSAYKMAIENGWMNQDEVRIEEDRNPIPAGEGKNYWRPLNWARLGDVHTSVKPKSGGDKPDEQTPDASMAKVDSRLKLLAASSSERCVRKEMKAVTALLERGASDAEITEFYSEHAGFLVEVLRIGAEQAKAYCDERAAQALACDKTTLESLTASSADQILMLTAIAVGEKQ